MKLSRKYLALLPPSPPYCFFAMPLCRTPIDARPAQRLPVFLATSDAKAVFCAVVKSWFQ